MEKVRPASDEGPGRWMTGTANFEGIAGTLAAVDYLAGLGQAEAGSLTRADVDQNASQNNDQEDQRNEADDQVGNVGGNVKVFHNDPQIKY